MKYVNVHADLPGMKKEDINIDVNNNVLSVSGERNEETCQPDITGRYINRKRNNNFNRIIKQFFV